MAGLIVGIIILLAGGTLNSALIVGGFIGLIEFIVKLIGADKLIVMLLMFITFGVYGGDE